MKSKIGFFAGLALILSSCGSTSIVTTYPYTGSYTTPVIHSTYSTTVTAPRTSAVTTTARVTAISQDIALSLDLQAVGAAFAQASTVQEFENILNNSSYMISNLDLNQDGYVDYLRVVETVEGYNHVFLIQAALGPNVFQDVATLVAEVPLYGTPHVQIIGSSYIYGANYYVQPVYIATPAIYVHLRRTAYSPWCSPWYWNHYPSCYHHPAIVHMGHYHAYVDTYMRNHRYCHVVEYPAVCHYPDYDRVCRVYQRNDYGVQHPERSFSVRTANLPAAGTSAVERAANARDLRLQMERVSSAAATNRVATDSYSTATRTSAPAAASTPAATGATNRAASTSTSTATRSTSSSTAATNRAASASSSSATRTGTPAAASTPAATGATNRAASTSTSTATRSTSSSTAATNRAASASSSSATRTSTPAATGATNRAAAARPSSSGSQATVKSKVSASGTQTTRTTAPSRSSSSSTASSSTASRATAARSTSARSTSGATASRSASSSNRSSNR